MVCDIRAMRLVQNRQNWRKLEPGERVVATQRSLPLRSLECVWWWAEQHRYRIAV